MFDLKITLKKAAKVFVLVLGGATATALLDPKLLEVFHQSPLAYGLALPLLTAAAEALRNFVKHYEDGAQ